MSRHRQIPVNTAQFSLFDSTMPLRSVERVDELPATARELVEVIGINATIDLVKAFGGDDLKIPQTATGTSRMWDVLVETVGPQAAGQLVQRFGGTPIYVPTCHATLRLQRVREIIGRFDAGEPFDTLRREFRITRRHLYRILKKSV